jgi:2-oxoglutarate decarboxylase
MFGDNDIAVSLTANPSHLEAVDPVLEGIVRAKQDILDKGDERVHRLPLMCTATLRSPARASSPRR